MKKNKLLSIFTFFEDVTTFKSFMIDLSDNLETKQANTWNAYKNNF